MSNTFMKFIDSCVGAIARKVQDEFDESKHPRDKGGRFSSKGGEGRGASALEETDFEKEAKKELGGKGADDEGYMGLSKEELAEEEEYENARERARREKDDDRVTGPEDRDYMNEEDDDASDPVSKMRKHLDDDLFELATRSESEEEFISKAERKIKQELWAVKSAPEELPVQGQKAEYALKKILSEIKSGTSEYW